MTSSSLFAIPAAALTALGIWSGTLVPAVVAASTAAVEVVSVGGRVVVAAAPFVAKAVLEVAEEVPALSAKAYRAAFSPRVSREFKDAMQSADGTFVDALDGNIITRAEASVDHVIPMADVAAQLGPESDAFLAFANDADNFIITSRANNSRKGAAGLKDSTAMFPDAVVDLNGIGRTVADKYLLKIE